MTVRIGLIGAGRIGAMHAAHLAALRGPGGEPAVRLSIVLRPLIPTTPRCP